MLGDVRASMSVTVRGCRWILTSTCLQRTEHVNECSNRTTFLKAATFNKITLKDLPNCVTSA